MKDYKRLTARRKDFIYEECGNCPNVNKGRGCTDKKCYEIIRNRLAELEDKIESGELCDRKETAREIADWLDNSLYWDEENVVRRIKEKFDLEDEK